VVDSFIAGMELQELFCYSSIVIKSVVYIGLDKRPPLEAEKVGAYLQS
jgi:hypothetical protein